MPPLQLEVCVDSVESAVSAERGGADRIELCAGLDAGGTTPSAGLILAVRQRVSIGVHVMIRPRAGDFCYSVSEFEIMKHDVEFCRRAGVDGIVTGILTRRRGLDLHRMRDIVNLARPMTVSMHRAFDEIRNWRHALAGLNELGVVRVLSAGGKKSAPAGAAKLRLLADATSDRTEITAGSGITFTNIERLLAIPSLRAVHVLSCVSERRKAVHSREFAGSIFRVREGKVKRLKQILLRRRTTST